MIEKILTNVKWHQLKKVISDDQNVIDQIMTKKINELVDAVNEMQTMFDAYTTRFRELDAETCQEIVHSPYMQNKRLKKALDIAIDALERILNHATAIDTARCRAEMALEQITALEQKDVK